MSKQVRTLIIAAVAVVVLGGLLAILLLVPALGGGTSSKASSTPSSDESITLVKKNQDADGKTIDDPVKKIVVKGKNGDYTIAPGEDGVLMSQAYKDLPVNTTNIDDLVSTLSFVSVTKKVIDAPDKPAEYGFDKPLATVTVTYHDDTEVTLEVGNQEPLKSGYYLRESGKTAIYLVAESFYTAVSRKPTDFIGTTLYSAPPIDEKKEGQATVTSVDFTGTLRKDQPLSLRLLEETDDITSLSSYLITKPYKRGTAENTAQTLLSGMTSLFASGVEKPYPDKADLKKYGLDTPYSVAKINLAIQATRTKGTSSTAPTSTGTTGSTDAEEETYYYNNRTHTVRLGGKNADGLYYAMVDDIPVVYLVSGDTAGWAETKYNDLVERTLFLTDITKVESISLTLDGKTTKFALTHYPDEDDNDKSLKVTVDGKQKDTPSFRTLYQVFLSVARNGETTEKPTGTPKIVFECRLTGQSEPAVLAKIYRTSATMYTCVMQDGDSYTIRTSQIDKLVREYTHFMNGEAVSAD